MTDSEIFYVDVHRSRRDRWDTDPFAPMIVTSHCDGGPRRELAELDPGDDDGFARVIGKWTRLVPYRG